MAVILPTKKIICVPKPSQEHFEILDNIFVTKTLTLPDGDVIFLPHVDDVVKLLSNMGINVDGCDTFNWYYEQPVFNDGGKILKPWWWQAETASFLVKNPYAFVTSTPRTGKTLSTLMAIDCVQTKVQGAALIVAPLTVANGGEWYKTCRDWFPNKRVQLVHKDRLAELKKPADIFLINPDGLKIVANELEKMVESGIISQVIFDELTEYGEQKSQRWKAANQVARHAKFRWGLTGTPGKPEKIYAQVRLIHPQQLLKMQLHTKTRWREVTELKVSEFKWIPREGHEEVVKKAMSPCIRFDKDQLFTIPIPQVITEEVELSTEQQSVSKKLIEEMQLMIDSNEINATSANTIALKLLQVSGGAVRSTAGEIVKLNSTPKLDKLVEILRRTPRKKVVFGAFTGVNNLLVDHIRSNGFSVEKIDGTVTGQKRSQILNDFLDAEHPHVLVCHPQTAAYGVELASADHIVCYGPPMSGVFIYQQLFERLSSSRQTAEETFVVHLSAGKQDKLSFSALANGVDISKNIVNVFTRNIGDWDE